MKCLYCKKEVTSIYFDYSSKESEQMWNDAIVEEIRAGYGSKFDENTFVICLCDECIEKLLKEELIKKV